MNLDKTIEAWLEKGLEAPDAAAVRATDTKGILDAALHGIPASTKGSIAVCPYHDRTNLQGIQNLFEQEIRPNDVDELVTNFGTEKQIKDNQECYGLLNGFLGSPESKILSLSGYHYEGIQVFWGEGIEEVAKDYSLKEQQVKDLIERAKERRGVQIALKDQVFVDFKILYDEPHDVLIKVPGGRLDPSYISGIKVYTDLELRELNFLVKSYMMHKK